MLQHEEVVVCVVVVNNTLLNTKAVDLLLGIAFCTLLQRSHLTEVVHTPQPSSAYPIRASAYIRFLNHYQRALARKHDFEIKLLLEP